MTVSSNPFPIRYSGDDTSTVFNVNAYFLAELSGDPHLSVIVRAADGTEAVKTYNTDYTVTGANDPTGGAITFTTAPITGETVVINRSVPSTQETDYIAYNDFPAESHERALDKLTMHDQERATEVDRALLLGATDVDGSGAFEARGNKIEMLGDPIEATDATNKQYVDAAIIAGGGGGGGGGGVSDHGLLTGLSDDDHSIYHTDARGDVRYNTKAEITSALGGKADTAHTHTASEVTDFSEAVDDRVGALVVGGTDISSTYDDAAGTLTLNFTGSGGDPAWGDITGTLADQTDLQAELDAITAGLTWDLPSLKLDHSATGDGSTDDTTAVNAAITAAKEVFAPEGIYDTTLAASAITIPVQGVGQIRDASNNLRGKTYNYIDAAPSSEGNEDSVETAFNGDLTHVPIAIEHRVIGAATAGQPTSGYRYVPELSPSYTYYYNTAGHNQSTSGNEGRTGLAAQQVKIMQQGQGDLVAFNFSAFVTTTKAGSTNFLANPAIVGINGSMGTSVAGSYFNPLEFDLNDAVTGTGYDCAAIGTVVNLQRTVATGAKSAVWMGHRVQSLAAENCDVAYSASGKFKVGLDLTPVTLEATQRAITMKSGQKIFFNAVANASGNTDANWFATTAGTEFINWDGSKMNIAVGNKAVIQAQETNVLLAPNNTATLQATASNVQVANDFKVSPSIGSGTNYFRVNSAGANAGGGLQVNGPINLYGAVIGTVINSPTIAIYFKVNGTRYAVNAQTQ